MSQTPVLVAAALLAACADSAAEEVAALDILYLGSGPQPSLLPAEPVAEQTAEQLPEPPGGSKPVPVPLPPVNACDALWRERGIGPQFDNAVENGKEEGNDHRLTLGEVEAMALEIHPALREAAGRVRAAQGNWVQVGLRPNPEIGYLGEEMGDAGTAGKQGGFVSKEFVTAHKLGLNRSVASQEVAAARERMEVARLQVLTTARIYYFEVLAAERAVELAKQLSTLAGESMRVSQERLKALDIPRVSLLQSQVERESALLVEQQASERYAAAWRQLSTAIGAYDPQTHTLDDTFQRPLPEQEWDAVRDRVLAENPELAARRYAVARARWAVRRASAGRVPNVDVEVGVAHDNATEDEIANVRVSMPLPVFDRNQGAIAEASGELAAAQAALQEAELAVEQRAAAALRDYTTARLRTIKYSERVLPIARESLDVMIRGYREGELDYLAVLTAQQTYADKNLEYLQDLETSWKKWAEIEGLLVGPVPDRPE
jgi:cobalt-zinc-cadmium efflux system outer membrane protein